MGLLWTDLNNSNPLEIGLFLTLWGLFFTVWYFAAALVAYFSPERADHTLLLFLFELAFGFEQSITLLYWQLLFPGSQMDAEEIIRQVLIHALPLATLWIQFLTTNLQVRLWSIPPLLIVAVAYLATNIGYTFAKQPVYSLLTFQDYQSYLYILGAVLLMVIDRLRLSLLLLRKAGRAGS